MTSLRRSLAWSFAENYTGLVFQFVATLIIARLITPAEMGIFSVAAVLAALASVIRDFGVGEYLIQEKELTANKIRAALTLNLLISWSMALLLLLGRDAAAAFYHEAGVGRVMAVQACNFLLIPLGAVTMAYLRREMQFRTLFLINTSSTIVGSISAIALALLGYSYMSLAWGTLAGVVVTVFLATLMRPKALPRWPGWAGVSHAFAFGSYASGVYIGGQLGKSLPDLVIGRVIGLAAVGLFGRAVGLIEIFNRTVLRAIMPVSLPYYAAQYRQGEDMAESYLATVTHLTALAWPFFALVGLLAYPMISVLYGPNWLASAPLVGILCGAALIDATFSLVVEILIAISEVRRAMILQLTMQGLKFAGVFIMAPYGLIAVCWAILATSVLGGVIAHGAIKRVFHVSYLVFAQRCLPSLGLLIVTIVLVGGTDYLLMQISAAPLLRLIAGGLAGALGWLAAIFILRHPLHGEVLGVWHSLGRLTGQERN